MCIRFNWLTFQIPVKIFSDILAPSESIRGFCCNYRILQIILILSGFSYRTPFNCKLDLFFHLSFPTGPSQFYVLFKVRICSCDNQKKNKLKWSWVQSTRSAWYGSYHNIFCPDSLATIKRQNITFINGIGSLCFVAW